MGIQRKLKLMRTTISNGIDTEGPGNDFSHFIHLALPHFLPRAWVEYKSYIAIKTTTNKWNIKFERELLTEVKFLNPRA